MRLIDADKLKIETLEIKRIMAEEHKIPLSKTILDCLLNIISFQPTIETDIEVIAKDAYEQGYTDGWKERFGEPDGRPKGEWICPSKHRFTNRDLFSDCSICEHTQMDETNFCPNCGADMRKEANK